MTLRPLARGAAAGLPLLLLALAGLAAVAAAPAARADEAPVCAGCDRAIDGQYYRFQNHEGGETVFCVACRDALPPCAFCRFPVRGGGGRDGLVLCPHCRAKYDALPACSWCGKRLTGAHKVIASRGLHLCPECERTRPACALCKVPLGLAGDGNEHCARCLERIAEAPACAVCGRPLVETHVVYTSREGGRTRVCRDCAERAPRCELCGVPSRHLGTASGRLICGDCQAKLPACRTCGAPMVTRTSFTLSEFAYCPDCVSRNPPCDSCGAPAAGGEALPDGRTICADCARDAVTDVEEVRAMLGAIRETFERSLGMPVRPFRRISFADKREITALFRSGGGDRERRMEEYPVGLFVREGESFDVHCLPSVRRDVLRGVLAHEFAHAFLAEHYPSVKSVEEAEGFCEWVRYRFMKSAGDARGVETLMRRDDFYGRAFRRFLDLEKAGGVAGVFDHVGRGEPAARNPKRDATPDGATTRPARKR